MDEVEAPALARSGFRIPYVANVTISCTPLTQHAFQRSLCSGWSKLVWVVSQGSRAPTAKG